MALVPVLVVAAALGYANNVKAFADGIKQIPGVKTFGAPLIIGGVAYGINRFVYANKWLRLVSAVGLVVGVWTWGVKAFSTDWAGDVGDADGTVADVR